MDSVHSCTFLLLLCFMAASFVFIVAIRPLTEPARREGAGQCREVPGSGEHDRIDGRHN